MVSTVLLLFSAFLFSYGAAAPASAGLNGDPCTTASQCRGSRTCYYLPLDFPSSFGPCDGRDECFCGQLELSDMICRSDDECVETGEVCASLVGVGVSGCISMVTVDKYPQLARTDVREDEETNDGIGPVELFDAEPSPMPLELLPGDVDAEPSPQPLQLQPNGLDAEESPLPTEEQLDDVHGEVTPLPTDDLLHDFDAEASPVPTDELLDDLDAEVSPEPEEQPPVIGAPLLAGGQGVEEVDDMDELQPSPESESSCIAVHHLEHMSPEQLLFDKHVWATVLCDEHGSCATPGHIVRFEGQPMMMKSYCKLVGCESRVQLVNSPKYVRKLSVPSRSPNLDFTAFAARYGSEAEEKVLKVAVRFGL